MNWKGRLTTLYPRAVCLARGRDALWRARTALQGEQRSGWPLMAAMVQQEMGVSRHVLEQMVVAGTHMVPFGTGEPVFGSPGFFESAASQEGGTSTVRTVAASAPSDLSWDWDPLMAIAEIPE